MKLILRVLYCMLMITLLMGCGEVLQPDRDQRIRVFLQEVEGYTVENNGQFVAPGEDAVFTLTLDRGIALTATDYEGNYRMETKGRTVILTLEDIRYPTRVTLGLTYHYAQLTYHANGGYPLQGLENSVTKSVSLSVHTRPNTDTGTDLFARAGHTLLCWNTEPDGTGTRVSLGSRVTTAQGRVELYAQWVPWADPEDFIWTAADTVTITGYKGNADFLVIPEILDGREVTAIAAGAFAGCTAETVVLPKSMDTVEAGAFRDCAMTELVLFDNIIEIGDDCFPGCENLQTLYINAIEAPYGYLYRKESCYADKVDLLINAQGKPKLVCYGGCSMWYNLDGAMFQGAFGGEYTVINMALNGTVNSLVQMQIMERLLEPGDIFFHTPELSSRQQLLTNTQMSEADKYLWCGIENNYDLFSWVDLRTVEGVFDSLVFYLESKTGQATYAQVYQDELGQTFMDATGSVAFFRNSTEEALGDRVYLDPSRVESLELLKNYYDRYQSRGVRVYLSYACVNLDAVPVDQQDNAQSLEESFAAAVAAMEGPVLISNMEDFFYHNQAFYDTNYHLRTQQLKENTAVWLRDLQAALEREP